MKTVCPEYSNSLTSCSFRVVEFVQTSVFYGKLKGIFSRSVKSVRQSGEQTKQDHREHSESYPSGLVTFAGVITQKDGYKDLTYVITNGY